MSVQSEITRLTGLRNSIRTKLIALGILSSSSADLDDCATGIDGITGRSSTDLSESGGTVTVPAGYYSSSATKTVASMTDQEIHDAVNTGWYGEQS